MKWTIKIDELNMKENINDMGDTYMVLIKNILMRLLHLQTWINIGTNIKVIVSGAPHYSIINLRKMLL